MMRRLRLVGYALGECVHGFYASVPPLVLLYCLEVAGAMPMWSLTSLGGIGLIIVAVASCWLHRRMGSPCSLCPDPPTTRGRVKHGLMVMFHHQYFLVLSLLVPLGIGSTIAGLGYYTVTYVLIGYSVAFVAALWLATLLVHEANRGGCTQETSEPEVVHWGDPDR